MNKKWKFFWTALILAMIVFVVCIIAVWRTPYGPIVIIGSVLGPFVEMSKASHERVCEKQLSQYCYSRPTSEYKVDNLLCLSHWADLLEPKCRQAVEKSMKDSVLTEDKIVKGIFLPKGTLILSPYSRSVLNSFFLKQPAEILGVPCGPGQVWVSNRATEFDSCLLSRTYVYKGFSFKTEKHNVFRISDGGRGVIGQLAESATIGGKTFNAGDYVSISFNTPTPTGGKIQEPPF